MGAEFTIRGATPADADPIAALQARAWQWAYRGILPDDFLDSLSNQVAPRASSRRARLTDQPGEERTWLAVDRADRLVGFVVTEPSRDEDAGASIGELSELYADPDFVGAGVGRRLCAHAIRD